MSVCTSSRSVKPSDGQSCSPSCQMHIRSNGAAAGAQTSPASHAPALGSPAQSVQRVSNPAGVGTTPDCAAHEPLSTGSEDARHDPSWPAGPLLHIVVIE